MIREVLTQLLESEDVELKVDAVWMTGEEGDEEKRKRGTSSMLVRRMKWNSKSGWMTRTLLMSTFHSQLQEPPN
jgi:acyl-CoA-binding protein